MNISRYSNMVDFHELEGLQEVLDSFAESKVNNGRQHKHVAVYVKEVVPEVNFPDYRMKGGCNE